MKREMSPENSTARGRDPDALAVSLYAQWCRADDHCGKAPDGRQFPKWSALSRAEQRRWSAVAILAHGLMRDDPDAIDNNAYNLAEQALAYPWTGSSLPPAAVAPEPDVAVVTRPVRVGGPFRDMEQAADAVMAENAMRAKAAAMVASLEAVQKERAQRAEDEAMASAITCAAAYVP